MNPISEIPSREKDGTADMALVARTPQNRTLLVLKGFCQHVAQFLQVSSISEIPNREKDDSVSFGFSTEKDGPVGMARVARTPQNRKLLVLKGFCEHVAQFLQVSPISEIPNREKDDSVSRPPNTPQ